MLDGIELAERWADVGTLEGYLTLVRIRQAQGDWGGVHTSNIYGKLSVRNRTEAVAKARGLGLLPLD